MKWRYLLVVFLIHGFLQAAEPARAANARHLVEQSVSQAKSAHPAAAQVQLLASVPAPALEILKADPTVRSCLEKQKLSVDQLPASWFSASQIHLAGPEENDLLVQPIFSPERSGCFHGVECCAWFWVYRQAGNGYELVLKVFASALSVRDSIWKGYRDIEAASGNAKALRTVTFRFDGTRYKEFRKRTTYKDD
jgi:hypothetical protein